MKLEAVIAEGENVDLWLDWRGLDGEWKMTYLVTCKLGNLRDWIGHLEDMTWPSMTLTSSLLKALSEAEATSTRFTSENS